MNERRARNWQDVRAGVVGNFRVDEFFHGDTGVRDFHVTEVLNGGGTQIAECATRAEALVRARVEHVRASARSLLWGRTEEMPLGELMEHLKTLERSDPIISEAISGMLSAGTLILSADRTVSIRAGA